MTSIYMPSSATSGGGSSELAGQVYGNTSNTIISTAAVTNKQLTGLSSRTGAVTASDTILTGISKLSGNAGAATSDNIENQIVKRDEAGGFSANKIKVSNVESTGSILNVAGDTTTTTFNLGSGIGIQAINVGNSGTGKTTIKLGGGTDEVQVNLPLKNASGSDVFNVGATACFVGSIGNPSGVGNTFVGTGISTTAGKFGTYNTGMGNLTLAALDTGGDFNVAMGFQALAAVTTGQYNIAIGSRAGWDPLPAKSQITGTGCTFIGTDSKPNSVTPLINATAIGSQAVVDASNTIQLGHVSLTAVKTSGTLYAAGLESIGTTLNIASANNTNIVNIGSGAGVQTINVGNNGTGATTINLGGTGDTVNISGTLNNITTTNTRVTDNTLVLNAGGAAASAGNAGIYFEEAGVSNVSFMQISSDRSKIELRAPSGTTITLNQSLLTTDVVTFAGLKLPTTGGTAATLDHYEEYTYQTKFTGAISETANITVKMVRVGKMVTLSLKANANTANGVAAFSQPLYSMTNFPARFYPDTVEDAVFIVPTCEGANLYKPGRLRIPANTGMLYITRQDDSNFIAGQTYGFEAFSISWTL